MTVAVALSGVLTALGQTHSAGAGGVPFAEHRYVGVAVFERSGCCFRGVPTRADFAVQVPADWVDAANAGAGFAGFVDARGRKAAEFGPGVVVPGPGETPQEGCDRVTAAAEPGADPGPFPKRAPLPDEAAGRPELRYVVEVFFGELYPGVAPLRYAYVYCVPRADASFLLTLWSDADEWSPDLLPLFDRVARSIRISGLTTGPAWASDAGGSPCCDGCDCVSALGLLRGS